MNNGKLIFFPHDFYGRTHHCNFERNAIRILKMDIAECLVIFHIYGKLKID